MDVPARIPRTLLRWSSTARDDVVGPRPRETEAVAATGSAVGVYTLQVHSAARDVIGPGGRGSAVECFGRYFLVLG